MSAAYPDPEDNEVGQRELTKETKRSSPRLYFQAEDSDAVGCGRSPSCLLVLIATLSSFLII